MGSKNGCALLHTASGGERALRMKLWRRKHAGLPVNEGPGWQDLLTDGHEIGNSKARGLSIMRDPAGDLT